ncbi:oligosaccharide flippase family protein [Xanthobacter sp. 126]|uniref:lipopolysaccharide biosynthesis protein n=1 Tax=Xanthobacter sp. 126 TaxID=1131814 RepID=UPI00045E8BAC|nr:oligosaccharide flippase family protein [Xanthobacter sp. 126]
MTTISLRNFRSLAATYGAYVGSMSSRGLELVGKLGLYMFGARALGLHDSGYFFLCLTWIGLISTVARGGFDKAVLRHMAAELAVGRGQEARRALLTGSAIVTAGGTLATLLTVALAEPLAVYLFHDPQVAHALRLSAYAILPQTLCIFVGYALVGFHRGAAGQLVQNGIWPVLTLGALFAGANTLDSLLYALAASLLAATVLGLVMLVSDRHRLLATPSPDAPADALPALWRTAMPLSVVEVVQIFLNSLPVLLLAVFGQPSAVGAFSVANRISMLIWVVANSIGTVAAPSFAARHRQGQWDELRALNRRVRLAVALFGTPVVAVMVFFPKSILNLVAPGFEVAAPALMVMGLGQLVNCLLPCQDFMLSMTGYGSVHRWLNIAQLVVCSALCAALIPFFGMMGAAIATAVFIAQGAIGTTLAVRHLMPKAL